MTKASIKQHAVGGDVYLPVVATTACGKRSRSARCLLDTGSTATFISQELAEQIEAAFVRNINLVLHTFTGSRKFVSTRVVRCHLMNSDSDNNPMAVELIVLPNLGVRQTVPSLQTPCVRDLKIHHGVELSDARSTRSMNIDILIGSDLYSDIVTQRRIALNCGAVALGTRFGWALQGPVSANPKGTAAVVAYLKASNLTLEEKVSAFWEVEEIAQPDPQLNPQIDSFKKLISWKNDRYEVPLMWKGLERPTPNKAKAARQHAIQRKRAEQDGNWSRYQEVMKEYTDFGALEVDPDTYSAEGYFLPHHAVVHPIVILTKYALFSMLRPSKGAMDCL